MATQYCSNKCICCFLWPSWLLLFGNKNLVCKKALWSQYSKKEAFPSNALLVIMFNAPLVSTESQWCHTVAKISSLSSVTIPSVVEIVTLCWVKKHDLQCSFYRKVSPIIFYEHFILWALHFSLMNTIFLIIIMFS